MRELLDPTRSPSVTARPVGHLLEFLAPGLVHGLGNSVFAVRGGAHVLGKAGTSTARTREVVLEAAERTEHLLDVMRHLTAGGDQDKRPAGLLMRRLVDVLKVPLRDRGLRVSFHQGSHRSPVSVDAGRLTRSVCEAVLGVAQAMPTGVEALLRLDLIDEARGATTFSIDVEAQPTFLPFPLDLAPIAAQIGAAIDCDGGVVREVESERLVVRVG